jgi:hypothetical protein
MITPNLKPGDRVRIRVENPAHGRKLGEKGTVLRVAPSSLTGEPVYVVTMDRDGNILEFYFLTGEIEPDL